MMCVCVFCFAGRTASLNLNLDFRRDAIPSEGLFCLLSRRFTGCTAAAQDSLRQIEVRTEQNIY